MTASELTHQPIRVGDHSLHTVEAGQDHPESLVFLHGWPEDWTAWRRVMEQACKTHHVVALDLPGVGESQGAVPGGEKAALAESIHQAVQILGLDPYVIVGHDAGALVAYAYLRKFSAGLKAAVLLSSAIPGVEPWSKVLADPFIWHFAFHSIPKLPETLVLGNQRVYFDYFFDILTKDHSAIDDATRTHYASAYGSPQALQAGFDWYRAFGKDAQVNSKDTATINTPLLYLRGEFEGGDMDEYINGFHAVGISSVTAARIPGSGHFTPEENPQAVWAEIARFLGGDAEKKSP
ncbi:MAG TPA: alpha/beta hydrolase [Ktedonobacteraceae bacterium]|jgi:pimeloyl-ACP methyl ester carboxylesterase